MNASELTESFIEFEKEYNMFDIWIDDLQIWTYVRFQVNEVLQQHLGLCSEATFTDNRRKKEKNVVDRLKEATIHNQFLATHRDVLIIPLTRKVMDNGQYKSIHTDLLDNALKRTHYIWERRNNSNQILTQPAHNTIYMNVDPFLKIKRASTIQFNKKWFDEQFIHPIETYFGINLESKYRKRLFFGIKSFVETRKQWVHYYRYMLNRIKPKAIVVVCYYYWHIMVLCETAKGLGIPVIELQHGIIGREHIAYNFPDAVKTKSLPDYLFAFGEFDRSAMRFPIPKKTILPVGFPELERNAALKKRATKSKVRNILFVSSMMQEIFICANTVAEKLDSEKYCVILKLHPTECNGWKKTFGKYITSKKIKIIDNENANIYSYLRDADWVVGTISTVLLEATLFDVKIAIIQTENSTAAEVLYKNGNAVLVEGEEELVSVITADQFIPKGKLSIFEKNSLEKMVNGIEYVIRTKV